MAVELDFGEIQVADGYVMDNIVVSPTTVVVTGPEEEVLNVASCVIRENITTKLNKSEVFTSKVILLDSDGNVINNSHLSLSVNEVDVTIPVLKCKTLPLTFNFLNMREDFDISSLKYQLSKQTLEVAGPEALIDKMSELNIGYINLEALGDETEYDFDIVLPSTFINIENITSVSVSFDFANHSQKVIEVKNIELKNLPAHYDVSVSTTKISYVNVMGPTDVLENIKSGDFVAELNLSEIDITVGQYKVPVSIYAPNHANVWAKGTHYVVVNIKAK
jgi:YbbR domain-containing protein